MAEKKPTPDQRRKQARESASARMSGTAFSTPEAAREAAQIRAASSGVLDPVTMKIPVSPVNVPTGVRAKKGKGPDTVPVTPRVSGLTSELAAYDANSGASAGQSAAIENIMRSTDPHDRLRFSQSVDAVNKRMIVSKHLDPVKVDDGVYMTRSDFWKTGRGRGSAPVSLTARPTTHNSLPALPSSPYVRDRAGTMPIRDAAGRVIMSGGAAGFGAAQRSVLEASNPGGPAGRSNRIAGLEHAHRAIFGGVVMPRQASEAERWATDRDPDMSRAYAFAESESGVPSDIGGMASGAEDVADAVREANLLVGYTQGMEGFARNRPIPVARATGMGPKYSRQVAATEARRAASAPQPSAPAPRVREVDGVFTIPDPKNIPIGTAERLASIGETAVVGPMKSWVDDKVKAEGQERLRQQQERLRQQRAEDNTRKAAKKGVTSESLGIGSIRQGDEAVNRQQKQKRKQERQKKGK